MAHSRENFFDFDKAADKYDQWYHSPVGKAYDRAEKAAVGSLLTSSGRGQRLLDIGCGTGHWSEYFSEKGFSVTGVDISPAMINKAAGKGFENCRFETGDGKNLRFSDDEFDAAAAVTVLEFSTEPEKIISEMVRCVKKEGFLIVGALNSCNKQNVKKQQREGSAHQKANLFSPAQLRDLLSPWGEVKMITAGFVSQNNSFAGLAVMTEFFGRLFNSGRGAFIAARVKL